MSHLENGQRKDSTKTSRRFRFTLNNPDEKEEDFIRSLPQVFGDGLYGMRCFVAGKELAPTTGTPHWQGYLAFTQPIRVSGVRKKCPFLARASIFTCSKSEERNVAYCEKDGDIVRVGNFEVGQGSRTDLAQLKELVDKGAAEVELWESDFKTMVRSYRAIREYKRVRRESMEFVRDPPRVYCFYGTTGTGKTRSAYEMDPKLYRFRGGKWFDGYEGQSTVLFDDFDGSSVPFRYLLQLLDRYPITVEVKGSHSLFNPNVIILTSNLHPKEWYRFEDYAPLERRFHEIRLFE